MLARNFDLADYLKRIQFQGEVSADLATLNALMRQQLMTIPFENLDVLAGKGVSIVPEDIVHKLVHQQRGGYCYEVNGLFSMVLTALGIPYQFVACRPMFYPVKRPKTHMALLVNLEGQQWLCDLGFGSYGIRAPMNLAHCNTAIRQDNDTFMLAKMGDEYVLQALVEGAWINQYGFNLCPQEWVDFAPANWMNSTHKDAVFTQKYLIVRFTPQGRSILFGDSFKQVTDSTKQRTLTPDEIPHVLQTYFGLTLPS